MNQEWDTKKSFELEDNSRRVRGYFSKMKKIRNDLTLRGKNYFLLDEEKKELIIKLDRLIDDKSLNTSIEGYFNLEIQETKNLHETLQVFYKYNQLLKECYGLSINEFATDVDIESKFISLQNENSI